MYILRLESQVGPAQRANFENWNTQLYNLASKQPGFIRSTLFNSIAYPLKWSRSSIWESREAVVRFWATKELQEFGAAHPAGDIFTAGGPMRAYEDIVMVREAGDYKFFAVADITITQGKAAAYIESRKQFLELVRREGRGVALTALAQQAGGGNEFVLTLGFRTQEDAVATVAMPAIAEFQQQHPPANFGTPLVVEGFELVQVAVGTQAGVAKSARAQ